jgi:hypothetical protein
MPEGAKPMTQNVWLSRPIDDAEFELDLRALIRLRTGQLEAVGDTARVVVVQGGDTPDIINTAVGFRITGDQPEPFTPDWIKDHGLWFEVAFGAGGDNLTLVFVENGPGTELGVHALCLSHVWAQGA